MTHPRDDALAKLYAQVPAIDCQGRCWTSCGAVDMSARERHRIAKAGHPITPFIEAMESEENFWCDALKDGRCVIYQLRPMLCRLWGVVETMPCVYGCVPERMLTKEEGDLLLLQSFRVGGAPLVLAGMGLEGWSDEQLLGFIRHPVMVEARPEHVARGQAGDLRRAREFGGLP
jgi:hypothetical protein